MATVIGLIWALFIFAVIDANAAGEFDVLHSPDSLRFSGSSKTLESQLKNIISACLGFTVNENTHWKGLYVTDPFNTPEAVVGVYIDGISNLGYIGANTKTFSLTFDEYESDIYETVKNRIKQKFPKGGNNFVNIKVSNAKELTTKNFLKVFGEIEIARDHKSPLAHLRYSVKKDYQFLNELMQLKAIAARVRAGAITPDNMLDVYNFHFRSLHALSNLHGPNSLQTNEAKTLLNATIQELNRAFVNAYDGSVLVTVIVTDHRPRKRAVRSPAEDDHNKSENDDDKSSEGNDENNTSGDTDSTNEPVQTPSGNEFDPDYPAIFNIILWFGVCYFFSLVAIVYAIMNMDPGRDSVIYRMTATKSKKDI